MRRIFQAALAASSCCAALVAAGPAWAGEAPLYQPAPAWVVPAVMPDVTKTGADTPVIVIFDMQQRIEKGQLWSYVDQATRIASPEMLAQAATLAFPWAPDKGDLVIHELSIQRGAERIDLLAKGQKFTVLRREQSLEQRELTGVLTATMAVEGLQVGDILRLRASTTNKDDALGGRVQDVVPVLAAPVPVAVAHVRISWPTDAAPHWKLHAEGIKAVTARSGAYTELTLNLPAPKQPETPADAPTRFRHPAILEVATFADWAEVSKTFAPLYATDGTIAPGSPLQAEVDAIMKADASTSGRAERALELVQDKIRYLAVGMNGGNYVPQKPARTWEVRYGDCKAKTVLLLALLHAMKIEAEPVLAHVGLGDFVADRLPSAAAFNHVFVKATIDGGTVWLDGTRFGSRMADLHDTPGLGYVLPVRAAGAMPLKIETHANARPWIDLTVVADESSSTNVPSAFEATAIVQGQPASLMTLAKSQLGAKEQREAVIQFLQEFMGVGQYSDASITPDTVTGAVTLKARGVTTTGWVTDDRRRKRAITALISRIAFDPDRSKAIWTAIPVVVNEPAGMRYHLRLRLPDGGRGFTMDGVPDSKESVAGYDIIRTAKLDGDAVTVDERVDSVGGEIAATRIPAERDVLATATARAPRVVAPIDTRRPWELTPGDLAGSTQIKAVEAVFAAAIAADPDEISGYSSRASLRSGIGDRRGAIADLTHAITIAASVDLYVQRAEEYNALNDTAAALADAESARALDPSSDIAIERVTSLRAERGDLASAVALLDQRIALGGSMRNTYRETKAGVLAEYGSITDAIALYDSLIAEKPGSPSLMNERCWAKGTRSVMLDTALKDCTAAIELSTDTGEALDSRAMVWFRMGKYDEALADLDATLASTPGRAESRFLRSIVLTRLKRTAEASKELAVSRRIDPSVERHYARYGIKAI